MYFAVKVEFLNKIKLTWNVTSPGHKALTNVSVCIRALRGPRINIMLNKHRNLVRQ